jgi:hypothetical protein
MPTFHFEVEAVLQPCLHFVLKLKRTPVRKTTYSVDSYSEENRFEPENAGTLIPLAYPSVVHKTKYRRKLYP